MKILTTVTASAGLDVASTDSDTIKLGSANTENNDAAVDNLTVWANADFKNNVTLGSSVLDNTLINSKLTASNGLYVNGNAGIGTTVSSFKLDVAGTGRFTSNVQVTGTINSSGIISAPALQLSNSSGYSSIEIGGPSGGYIDLKRPYSDDYDLRLITDSNVESGGYLLAAGGAILSLSGTGVAVGQYTNSGYKFFVAGTTRLANTVEIGQSGTLSLYDNATQVVIQYPNKQVTFYDSTAAATRMLIDTAGNVGIGTTSPTSKLDVSGTVTLHNIKFPAVQVSSADANTLDDYEEGTWTPTLSASTTSNFTYVSQAGTYNKTGRQIIANGYILLSSTGSSSGNLRIGSLPFISIAGTAAGNGCVGTSTGLASAITVSPKGVILPSNTLMSLYKSAAGGSTVMNVTDATNNTLLSFTAIYFTT